MNCVVSAQKDTFIPCTKSDAVKTVLIMVHLNLFLQNNSTIVSIRSI